MSKTILGLSLVATALAFASCSDGASTSAASGWQHPRTAWGDPDLQGSWPIMNLISTPFQRTSRRFVNEVCEGLVPALQRRGLVREAYTQPTLRQTLREF